LSSSPERQNPQQWKGMPSEIKTEPNW